MKPNLQSLKLLLLFELTLLGCCWWLYIHESFVPAVSLFGAALGFLVWLITLQFRDRNQSHAFIHQLNIQKPHYIQALIQVCVYSYWTFYWQEVIDWYPLILSQLLFAYLFEALLAWSRHRSWRIGFGPFPIVLSVNLFLWFKEEYFYLQLVLIAVTYLSKDFVTWNKNGRRAHIFNPSSFSLALTGLVLIATDRISLTRGLDVIESFYIPPNFFELLFILGLIVQFFFSTTLITMGATLSLSAIFFGLKLAGYPPEAPFDVSVFLGLNLLVTDPSTSSKTKIGQFIFGLTYGACTFLTFATLRYTRQPPYFDKILAVVIVNTLARQCDLVGEWILCHLVGERLRFNMLSNRYVHMGAYVVLFIAILPSLKQRDSKSVQIFPAQTIRSTIEMRESLAKALALDIAYPDVRKPFGFVAEYKHLDDRDKLNSDTVEAHFRIGKALAILGEIDLAIQQFERTIEIEPRYAQTLNPLIEQLRAAKPPDEGMQK